MSLDVFFKDENQTKLQIWQSFRKKGKKLKKFCSFTYCISRLDSQMKLWKKSGKRFREARRPFSGDFFSHISLLNSIQLVLLLALGLKRLCLFFFFFFFRLRFFIWLIPFLVNFDVRLEGRHFVWRSYYKERNTKFHLK